MDGLVFQTHPGFEVSLRVAVSVSGQDTARRRRRLEAM